MREHISRKKQTTTGFSIPSLKQPIRGFGLESSAISRQAVPEIQPLNKPLTHDISRIPLRSPQAKLSISQPGDKYEQEADSVAQQVMQRMAQPVNRQSIQRVALPESEEELQMKPLDISTLQRREALPEEEEELQMKSLDNSTLQRQEAPENESELQMKPMVQRQARMAATPDLEASINQGRGGGVAIADNIRQPMEQAFGADFSGVKIHTDGQSNQLNRSIQARAFTTGQDVFFRQGEYNPGSPGGQELLAHELTHVVQQTGTTLQRQVIQRLMTTNIWQQSTQSTIFRGNNNPELIQVDNLLLNYHQLTDINDPQLEQRLQMLTDIETTVYRWYYRHFNRKNPSQSTRLTAMYDLLDDVAVEYQTLVTQIANNNARLPIPNVNNNNAVTANSTRDLQLQQLWQSIINETGNINFSTQTAQSLVSPAINYPDFKQQMLPIFARLLRTPTGRQLIEQILNTQPTGLSNQQQTANIGNVTVRPMRQQDRDRGSIASVGVKQYDGNAHLLGSPPNRRGIGSYLSASATDEETQLTREGNAGRDTRNNPLLSPRFIILAHELIHVLHNLKGENRRNQNQGNLDDWGNEEEKATTSGRDANDNPVDHINEQAIRNEYGLDQERYGHDE